MKTFTRWALAGAIMFLYSTNLMFMATVTAVLVTLIIGQFVFVLMPGGSNDLLLNRGYVVNLLTIMTVFVIYWGLVVVAATARVI